MGYKLKKLICRGKNWISNDQNAQYISLCLIVVAKKKSRAILYGHFYLPLLSFLVFVMELTGNPDWKASTPSKLKYHRNMAHSDVIYSCDKCSITFKLKDHLVKHQKIHDGVKVACDQEWKCCCCFCWAEFTFVEVLFVQKVVTLQKIYSNIFASEN